MRSNHLIKAFGVVALGAGFVVQSLAQGTNGWFFECRDPDTELSDTYPYNGYSRMRLENALMGMIMGTGGTISWGGGENGFCYADARQLNASGRFAFYVGAVGSRQTSFDDGLALTVGAPTDAFGDYCYARIIRYTDPAAADDSKTVLFGDPGLAGFFVGASKRYFIGIFREGNVETELEARVIGDAARLRWRLKNQSAEAMQLGLKFGAYTGMRTSNAGVVDVTGANQANSLLGTWTGIPKPQVRQADGSVWVGFNTNPETKPLRVERNWLSKLPGFPAYAKFLFGQADAYGMRIDNGPFTETPDAASVSQLIIGNHGGFQSPALLWDNVMNSRVFDDFGNGDPVLNPAADPIKEVSDNFLEEVSFVQTFTPQAVQPGRYRDVIHYIRSPWAVADYRDPYAAVVDAPRLIATAVGSGTNDLTPNPFKIIAYIDNQYATVDREVPLSNVRFTLQLPEGSGLSLVPGEPQVKVITTVGPNEIRSVEWEVEADGDAFGEQPYSVKIEPVPGPTRTLTGKVLISATPRVRLTEGANLVTFPWTFTDSSLDSIFDAVNPGDTPLKLGVDYLAYKWEPDLGEYIPVSTVERGRSIWIVPVSDLGMRALKGASSPADTASGGLIETLRPGWNMIGNPYSFQVVLSQLVAVAEDDPADAMSWQELVNNGLVSPSLAYWERDLDDPMSGSYRFTSGTADVLQPHTGYWIYVTSYQPIRLSWPAVYLEGLPGSTRSKAASTWKQTDSKWRLQLAARNDSGMDSGAYLGVAGSKSEATMLRTYKPPKSPSGKIEISIAENVDGKQTRLAQSFTEKLARTEWRVLVRSDVEGDVTVTWPNVNTIPRNVRMQLVDPASNTSRDMRFSSSYTFRMDQPGTRELKVQMEPGGTLRAVIGNVVVTRPSKDPRAPFTISYALSAQATTTIRVLSSGGKEVYTVTRGRADRVGENNATWTMRDNANRAVAPGAYQVEILAETATGERVRKIVPVNVVR